MDCVKLLLENGAGLNIADKKGQTPLHVAAQKGQTDYVRLLMQKGAKIDVKDKQDKTALKVASSEKIRDLIQPPPPTLGFFDKVSFWWNGTGAPKLTVPSVSREATGINRDLAETIVASSATPSKLYEDPSASP